MKKINRFFSYQFLLVFAVVLMVLGTIANLDAIDEKQKRIHESPALIPVADPLPFVDKMPHFVQNDKSASLANEFRDGGSIDKRNPDKMHKIPPLIEIEKIAAPENISVRQEDLKEARAKVKLAEANKETISQQIKPDVKIMEKASDIRVVQLAEKPETEKIAPGPERPAREKVDSVINKDAIQKEEQEIAIEAKEDKQKNLETAKEILNEVKNELAKQNQETQKLVLDKIDKISEKMNKIEQLQVGEIHRDLESPKTKDEQETLGPAAVKNNNHKDDRKNNKTDEKSEQKEVTKNIIVDAKLPESEIIKDSIVESILPKTNVDQPHADPADRIGRDLLSTKLDRDSLAKLREKRSSKLMGNKDEEENAENDEEKEKLPRNTAQIKNIRNPKYSERRINILKKEFKGKTEMVKSIQQRNKVNEANESQFDDNRFDKYAGLDDSYVFRANDTQTIEDKKIIVVIGNDLETVVGNSIKAKNDKKVPSGKDNDAVKVSNMTKTK